MINLFSKIKSWYFYRFVNRNSNDSTREKKVANINTAKTFGVLYDASSASNNSLIVSFAEKLKKEGKDVQLLAFIKDKKSESNDLVQFFNPSHLNWYKIPSSTEVDQFTAQKFDILISAHVGEHFPLQFISAQSKAKFRMGPYIEKATTSYDWMIQTPAESSLAHYLKQVDYYLHHINS